MKDAMTEEYQTDENGNVVKDENGNPIRIPKMTYYTTDAGGGVAFAAIHGDGSQHGRDRRRRGAQSKTARSASTR